MPCERKNGRYRPSLDVLDRRDLPAAGVTASLHGGVLSVSGTSATTPIVLDVFATPSRKGITGVIVVEGVGSYKAALVKQVVIHEVWGESVIIHRAKRWNPSIQVVTPVSPAAPPVVTTPPVTAPPVTSPPSVTLSAAQQAIVGLVNQYRGQNGLVALKVNAKLVQAAQIHANDMAAMNLMAHDLPGAALPGLADRARFVGYQYSTMGENIAYNFPDAASVMNAWMNSPGHRANILDSSYTEIGVGIALDSQGSPYYCQVFGSPG